MKTAHAQNFEAEGTCSVDSYPKSNEHTVPVSEPQIWAARTNSELKLRFRSSKEPHSDVATSHKNSCPVFQLAIYDNIAP